MRSGRGAVHENFRCNCFDDYSLRHNCCGDRFFEGSAAPFSWEPDHVEVLGSGSLALSTGPVYDPAGRIIGRFNSIWRREASGQWRVVFDKAARSVPALLVSLFAEERRQVPIVSLPGAGSPGVQLRVLCLANGTIST